MARGDQSNKKVGAVIIIIALTIFFVFFSGGKEQPPAKRSHSTSATAETKTAEDRTKTTAVKKTTTTNGEWNARFSVQLSDSKEGSFVIKIHPDWAPLGAARFRELVEANFYDEARFFRVIDHFMAQFGISATPRGGDKWGNIKDDPVKHGNYRGTVSFAMAGPNTRTTQLFINFGDNTGLDGQGFAAFGEVVEGMEYVDAINKEYVERPDQGQIQAHGNGYLTQNFPRLSYIKTIRIE